MWESYVVAKAREWVGQKMTWVGQSSNRSNFRAAMVNKSFEPPSGLTPSMGWSMTCYEMPLLAGVNTRSITRELAAQISANPETQLARTWTTDYNPKAWGGMPGQGCLVFWKMRQKSNKLLGAFDKLGGSDNTSKWGLDHVALAIGTKAKNGHSEIISFWEDNTVTLTDVDTVTTAVQNALGNAAVMDVTFTSGPWAYY